MLIAPGSLNRTIVFISGNSDRHILFRCAAEVSQVRFHLRVLSNDSAARFYLCGKGAYSDRGEFPFPQLLILNAASNFGELSLFLQWLRSPDGFPTLPVVLLTPSHELSEPAYAAGANAVLLDSGDYAELRNLATLLDHCLSLIPVSCRSLARLPAFCPPNSGPMLV